MINFKKYYDHSIVAGISFLITAAGIFIALRIELLIGRMNFWERFFIIIFSFSYIAIICSLFYKNGIVEKKFWFRKYVLTTFLFLAVLAYNIMNIVEMVGKFYGVREIPLLYGTSMVTLFAIIPFIIFLYIMTLVLEAKYLSKQEIVQRIVRIGSSIGIFLGLFFAIYKIMSK